MKFRMVHKFGWPAGKITELLAAGEDICDMEDLPNVSSRKILERKREGKKIYNKIEWNVHGQIPKIAQKILRPEMLTFVEDSVWDDDTTAFTTRIIPHYLKDVISCKTVSTWGPDGAEKSKRTFEGELNVKIPIVGPVAEKAIVEHLKKNNDENFVMVSKYLEKKFGQPAK